MHAPAAERNRDALLAVLREIFPLDGVVLEVASGSGQHVVHYAQALPGLTFVPSDLDAGARASVDAWVQAQGLTNVRPALELDATAPAWPLAEADAVVCCNMIHIAPWSACEGLLSGAARVLPAGGPLCLYGPFAQGGEHTAASNASFDASLRARDPSWGVRDLDDVVAASPAFSLRQVIEMPANNLTVVLERL